MQKLSEWATVLGSESEEQENIQLKDIFWGMFDIQSSGLDDNRALFLPE